MFLDYEIIPTDGRFINWINKSGTVYGSSGNTLYKTDDFLATDWEVVHEFAGQMRQVREMPEGSLVVALQNGEMWKSNDAQDDWSQAMFDDGTTPFEMESAGGHVQYGFGLDWYGDILVAAEYGSGTNKAYMSGDKGETWERILTNPDPTPGHFHDIAFDPYENIIWACAGDGGRQNRIFYSHNFGYTWQQIPIDYEFRATQIIPLPDCVLFGSDDTRGMYIARYDRHDGGTPGQEVKPEIVWSCARQWYGGTPWMTHAAITHGENAEAYFGFLQGGGNIYAPSTIWKTTDGKKFMPVWVEPRLPEHVGATHVGILGTYGPDENNVLVARLVSRYDDTNEQLLKVQL